MQTTDLRSLIILGGLGVVVVLVLIILLPLIGRLSFLIEAASLLSEPLGDCFGNRRVVLLGCVVLGLVVAGCCIIVVGVGSALLTCGTANPSQFCHMIGR